MQCNEEIGRLKAEQEKAMKVIIQGKNSEIARLCEEICLPVPNLGVLDDDVESPGQVLMYLCDCSCLPFLQHHAPVPFSSTGSLNLSGVPVNSTHLHPHQYRIDLQVAEVLSKLVRMLAAVTVIANSESQSCRSSRILRSLSRRLTGTSSTNKTSTSTIGYLLLVFSSHALLALASFHHADIGSRMILVLSRFQGQLALSPS
jgi:hypothetical protein